ncbi:hypothetical protein HDU90_002293 [Geranomyces variabilis]|nr:hypothetical protein HDU90_002293 [Geranomyces variabilis]
MGKQKPRQASREVLGSTPLTPVKVTPATTIPLPPPTPPDSSRKKRKTFVISSSDDDEAPSIVLPLPPLKRAAADDATASASAQSRPRRIATQQPPKYRWQPDDPSSEQDNDSDYVDSGLSQVRSTGTKQKAPTDSSLAQSKKAPAAALVTANSSTAHAKRVSSNVFHVNNATTDPLVNVWIDKQNASPSAPLVIDLTAEPTRTASFAPQVAPMPTLNRRSDHSSSKDTYLETAEDQSVWSFSAAHKAPAAASSDTGFAHGVRESLETAADDSQQDQDVETDNNQAGVSQLGVDVEQEPESDLINDNGDDLIDDNDDDLIDDEDLIDEDLIEDDPDDNGALIEVSKCEQYDADEVKCCDSQLFGDLAIEPVPGDLKASVLDDEQMDRVEIFEYLGSLPPEVGSKYLDSIDLAKKQRITKEWYKVHSGWDMNAVYKIGSQLESMITSGQKVTALSICTLIEKAGLAVLVRLARALQGLQRQPAGNLEAVLLMGACDCGGKLSLKDEFSCNTARNFQEFLRHVVSAAGEETLKSALARTHISENWSSILFPSVHLVLGSANLPDRQASSLYRNRRRNPHNRLARNRLVRNRLVRNRLYRNRRHNPHSRLVRIRLYRNRRRNPHNRLVRNRRRNRLVRNRRRNPHNRLVRNRLVRRRVHRVPGSRGEDQINRLHWN